jgi:hypothetical protein
MAQYEYKFQSKHQLNDVSDDSDQLIWLFHVDKIPPHIGISSQGVFYSLKSNGQDEIPTYKVNQIIENKSIKLIKVKLRCVLSSSALKEVFANYTSATSSGCSCLVPIREALQITENVQKLASLLNHLEAHNKIEGWYAKNVSFNEAGIRPYEVHDIEKRLDLLNA